MRLGRKGKREKEGRLLIARFLKSIGQTTRTTKLPGPEILIEPGNFSENLIEPGNSGAANWAW
jgi:hypothetical protein